jgi:hypothetical protein
MGDHAMTPSMSRRELLLAGAATAIAGFPPSAFSQAPATVDEFLKLSERLTGASDLGAGIAKTLLDGLLATGKGNELAALAADRDGSGALADAIVGSWYSGIYETADGPAVAAFDQALVWDALTFTKPFASCGGETGYWSEPPQG